MKAVVLETRGKEAAVLVRDGTVRIARGRYDVGDIIDFSGTARPALRHWAAAAAVAIAAIGLTTGFWIDRNYITYAEVSLDVNPSIIYSVNKRDRVLSVQAANGDAEGIVEQLQQESIRFMPLSEAVEKTMAVLEDEGYLAQDQDDYVLINVSAEDDTRQGRLAEAVESAMAQTTERDSTLEYHIECSDRNAAREARENGMSAGRYAAWKHAKDDAGPDEQPALEEYSDKPVREILGNAPDADRPTGAPDAAPMGDRESAGQQDSEAQSPEPQTPETQSPGHQGKPDGPSNANPPAEDSARRGDQAADPEKTGQPAGDGKSGKPTAGAERSGDPPAGAEQHDKQEKRPSAGGKSQTPSGGKGAPGGGKPAPR